MSSCTMHLGLNESNHFRLKVENEWQRYDMLSLHLRRSKVSRSNKVDNNTSEPFTMAANTIHLLDIACKRQYF